MKGKSNSHLHEQLQNERENCESLEMKLKEVETQLQEERNMREEMVTQVQEERTKREEMGKQLEEKMQ